LLLEFLYKIQTISNSTVMATLHKEYSRRLNENVRAATHSPTADLIAVATEDNRLTVHRLADDTFQKLFVVGFGGTAADAGGSALSPITALTWRPDGRTLALGHDDGSFSIYHIQNKTKIRLPKAARPHSERVTCLHWESCRGGLSSSSAITTPEAASSTSSSAPFPHHTEDIEDPSEVYDAYAAAYGNGEGCHISLGPDPDGRASRLSRVPPKPQSLGKDDTVGGGLSSDATSKEQEETEFALTHGGNDQPFTILASGDSTGVVTLSAYGYFPVGCVDLSGAFVEEEGVAIDRPTVCNVRMTPDVSILTVTLRARVHHTNSAQQASSISTSSSSSSSAPLSSTTAGIVSPTFRYQMCHVDTSLLYERRYELSEIALHFGAIGELLEHMKETFTSMQTTWVESVRALDYKWDSLRTILQSHGRRPSPRGELLVALLSGIHSEPLSQWCASNLSPQKVVRMHKSLDAACVKVDQLYRQHFHVAMEGLLYRLSELRGLSRWRRYFLSIGLLHQSLQELVQCASTLLLKGEEFICDVRGSRIAFRALCTFLHGLATTTNNLDTVPHQRTSRKMYDVDVLLKILRGKSNGGGGGGGHGRNDNTGDLGGLGGLGNLGIGGNQRHQADDMEDDGPLSQRHVLEHFRLSPSSSTSVSSSSSSTSFTSFPSVPSTSFGQDVATQAIASMMGTSHTALSS
jgi:anaphase-promoting complex subunit 4